MEVGDVWVNRASERLSRQPVDVSASDRARAARWRMRRSGGRRRGRPAARPGRRQVREDQDTTHQGDQQLHRERHPRQRPDAARPPTATRSLAVGAALGSRPRQVREGRRQVGRGPCRPDLLEPLAVLLGGDPAHREVLAQLMRGLLALGVADPQSLVHRSSSPVGPPRARVQPRRRRRGGRPGSGRARAVPRPGRRSRRGRCSSVPVEMICQAAFITRPISGFSDAKSRAVTLLRVAVALALEGRPHLGDLVGVRREVVAARVREPEGTPAPLVVALDQALVLELRDRRVDRAGARAPGTVGALGDLLDHLVAVQRLVGEHREDRHPHVTAAYPRTARRRLLPGQAEQPGQPGRRARSADPVPSRPGTAPLAAAAAPAARAG